MQERERDPHSKTIIYSKTHDAMPDSSDYHNHHRPCIMLRAAFPRRIAQHPTSHTIVGAHTPHAAAPNLHKRRSAYPLHTQGPQGKSPLTDPGGTCGIRPVIREAYSPRSWKGHPKRTVLARRLGRFFCLSSSHVIKSCNTG